MYVDLFHWRSYKNNSFLCDWFWNLCVSEDGLIGTYFPSLESGSPWLWFLWKLWSFSKRYRVTGILERSDPQINLTKSNGITFKFPILDVCMEAIRFNVPLSSESTAFKMHLCCCLLCIWLCVNVWLFFCVELFLHDSRCYQLDTYYGLCLSIYHRKNLFVQVWGSFIVLACELCNVQWKLYCMVVVVKYV